MKNSIKLEKVKLFLDENNIKYEEREKRFGHSDLWIPKARVAIKIEGDDSMAFFETHNKTCCPVFIREDETLEFVIEKLQAAIVKSMMKQQQNLMRRMEKEEKLRAENSKQQ